MAAQDGQPRPGPSTEFTAERNNFGVRASLDGTVLDPRVIIDALPVPRVDGDDPAAAFLATVTVADPARLLDELADAPQLTTEVRLRMARARIELGDPQAALRELDAIPGDWRVHWHRGLAALASDHISDAKAAFEIVYDFVPGEAAPKLALAVCAELAGN